MALNLVHHLARQLSMCTLLINLLCKNNTAVHLDDDENSDTSNAMTSNSLINVTVEVISQ